MAELKPGWQRVKFGDVVRLNKETCKDPEAEGIERVLGLEHLEPGNLRIRSWGHVADGTTFTNRVRPGQVLFGKRRAYQRKVALVDFEAVCSGDIYVLESGDTELLNPQLLPFICKTDAFFEHAVGTSAGSLSPRTNWKSLAEYEFMLPPIDEQYRLARLCSSLEAVFQSCKYACDRLEKAFRSSLRAHMSTGIGELPEMPDGRMHLDGNWRVSALGEIAIVQRGMFSHRPRNLPEFFGGRYPFAQTGDIAESRGYLGRPSQTLRKVWITLVLGQISGRDSRQGLDGH